MLELLGVAPGEAVMVGDTVEDDVEGALAVGMRAILVDRDGRYPDGPDRLADLRGAARGARAHTRVTVVAFIVWVVVAIALAIGEVLTPGLFFLGPVALAAVAAAVGALAGAGTVGSFIIFIVCSIASLAFLRPIARRHVRLPALSRTGTDALVGRKGIVTRRVDAAGGRIRIGGEEWSARAYLDGQAFAEGQTVDVIQIEGVTALVAE